MSSRWKVRCLRVDAVGELLVVERVHCERERAHVLVKAVR
jgi:hypothetical protein